MRKSIQVIIFRQSNLLQAVQRLFLVLINETELGRKEFSDQNQLEETADNQEIAFEQEIIKCKTKIVLKPEMMNISLETFSKAFVEDGAKFSWKRCL